ncbi:hypothetical protein KJ590_04660, partial [Patescibacteria group bacterium]|nr:hypothetical protein [Patescibacteria group bacterium]
MTKLKKLFYFNILVYILLAALIFPGICYSQPDALRVPIGGYTRLEDYVIQAVLTQQVFPTSFLREIFSETGIKIEYTNKQGILESIDLSFPGINDGIMIRFVDRKDIDNQPFTKTEQDEKTIYTIAQDITFNETRYLLHDIDSILERYGNRLTLSNTFSLRLRQLAIYLAKGMTLEALANDKSNSLKREIENLYLLGLTLDTSNIIRPDNPIIPLAFEDIKSQDSLYETDILDYMKANNNLFTRLTSGNTNKFIGNIRKIMIKEAIVAIRINFNSKILSKGAEKLFLELEMPDGPVKELLKDNLPIEDWRKRLKNATENEEAEIVKEIVQIVDKYPGWKAEKYIDSAIRYTLSTQEMNCLMRSILLSRILKEIGIGEDRLYTVGFPEHVFLIMRLKSGDYLEIQTTEDAFNYTRILSEGIKTGLDKAVKKAKLLGSASLTLEEPLWGVLWPESKVLTIYNNLEGLIENSYINLTGFEGFQVTKEQKIKLYKMAIVLLQEAIDIDPNNADAFYNWGNTLRSLAMIEKDTNPEKAIKYLEEACAKYEKATTINPDYAYAFNNWGIALRNLAMIEKDTNPEEAIKYLEEASAKYEKATTINPDYAKAFYNWGTSLNDLAMIEKDTNPKEA